MPVAVAAALLAVCRRQSVRQLDPGEEPCSSTEQAPWATSARTASRKSRRGAGRASRAPSASVRRWCAGPARRARSPPTAANSPAAPSATSSAASSYLIRGGPRFHMHALVEQEGADHPDAGGATTRPAGSPPGSGRPRRSGTARAVGRAHRRSCRQRGRPAEAGPRRRPRARTARPRARRSRLAASWATVAPGCGGRARGVRSCVRRRRRCPRGRDGGAPCPPSARRAAVPPHRGCPWTTRSWTAWCRQSAPWLHGDVAIPWYPGIATGGAGDSAGVSRRQEPEAAERARRPWACRARPRWARRATTYVAPTRRRRAYGVRTGSRRRRPGGAARRR